jgi:hypothetical protein
MGFPGSIALSPSHLLVSPYPLMYAMKRTYVRQLLRKQKEASRRLLKQQAVYLTHPGIT